MDKTDRELDGINQALVQLNQTIYNALAQSADKFQALRVALAPYLPEQPTRRKRRARIVYK